MADEKLKARSTRVWFVVMLGAIVALAGAPSIVHAQTTGDEPSGEEGSGEGASGESGEGGTTAPDATSSDTTGDSASDSGASGDAASGDAASDGSSSGASGLASASDEAEEEESETATDEATAEEVQAEREPLPWRNSFFILSGGTSPNSFFRDAQLSYNPLFYVYGQLLPRWYLDAQTFFVLSEYLYYEATNSDGDSSYNHDLQLSDLWVELRRTIPWEGFVFIPSVRLTVPTSKASQAAQRYFSAGAGLTAVRVIPEAWGLTIALQGAYRYWFAGSNVPLTMGSYPGNYLPPTPVFSRNPDLGGGDADPTINQASGSTSTQHIVLGGITINVTPFEGFNVSLAAYYLGYVGHGLATGCVPVATSPDGGTCIPDQSPTHWRHYTSLSFSIAYDIQPWFNLSLGWANGFNLTPLFADDGSVYSPFNPINQFSLTATFQIDGIYETITAGGEDDGLTPEQRQRRRQGLAHRQSTTGGSL